jgi:dynein heavy chain
LVPQAKKWIRATESKNKLQITRMNNPNMLRTLESCIRIGTPLLIEDCGEFLDPALEPVLQVGHTLHKGLFLMQDVYLTAESRVHTRGPYLNTSRR